MGKNMRFKNNKHQENGFTLIELIVVVFIIGVLSAIALPSFLNQSCTNKAEAQTYLGSMNRGQQAFYLENKVFADSIEKIGIGIQTETTNYKYSIEYQEKAVFHYALTKDKKQNSFVGAVFIVPEKNQTVTILCKSTSIGQQQIALPKLQDGVPICGYDSEKISYFQQELI
ncbi:MAG: prepilin-type N-terminal cleavage/methylation domain-containing protein [Moorea sp. SIO2B7]|nr:prepilin-type N-terminal cleavage/methylation domain-containing protein [Moorena sp. SIO2B7]